MYGKSAELQEKDVTILFMRRVYVFTVLLVLLVVGSGIFIFVQARNPVVSPQTSYDLETPIVAPIKTVTAPTSAAAQKTTLQQVVNTEKRVLDKWTQAVVQTTCTFQDYDIVKKGWGLVLNDYPNSPVLFAGIHSAIIDIPTIPTGVQLYNSCEVTFGNGVTDTFFRSSKDYVVTENNSIYKKDDTIVVKEKYPANKIDGILATPLPFLLPNYFTLDVNTDVCKSHPSIGDEVILVGVNGQVISTLRSSIVGIDMDYPGLLLAPTQSSDDTRFFVIDADENCLIGFTTKNREKILYF